MTSDVKLFLFLGFPVVVAFVYAASWYLSSEQKVKRTIRKLPLTPIGRIKGPGLVKVQGTVRTLDTLTAPLSGRVCAYFEVLVEEGTSSSQSHQWRTVIRDVGERDFLIEDESGRARVEMVAVQAAVVKDGHWASGILNNATPELDAFLERHGQKSQGWVLNRTLRYREGVIEPGETVAVVGFAELEQDPEPSTSGAGYRNAPMRPVLRANGEDALLVSDDPSTLG